MSTDKAKGHISSLEQADEVASSDQQAAQAAAAAPPTTPLHKPHREIPVSDTTSSGIPSPGSPLPEEQKPSAGQAKAASSGGQHQQPTSTTGRDEDDPLNQPRQVIAVSASRGPAAFFNLARKFLVTDEMCDLSALEGAIVSAVDAAHLLERSKLATIVRIQTSYVTVEPKRRKQQGQSDPLSPAASASFPSETTPEHAAAQGSASRPRGPPPSGGRELRRARIVITVKRTESYERWLEENPLQAMIAAADDDEAVDASTR